MKRYKSIVDAIRFAILEFTKINLNDINKSIKKLARLDFEFFKSRKIKAELIFPSLVNAQ